MAPPKRFQQQQQQGAATLKAPVGGYGSSANSDLTTFIGDDLAEAATRLLQHEGARRVESMQTYNSFEDSVSSSRSGRVMVHNGRFLGATLRQAESHNNRRDKQQRPCPAPPDDEASRDAVEIVLGTQDAGIFFERSECGRPVVRGLKPTASAELQRQLGPGMVLAKIAGVKCKAIEYAAALDLIRALDRPLTLSFKRQPPKKKIVIAEEDDGSQQEKKAEKKKKKTERDDDDDDEKASSSHSSRKKRRHDDDGDKRKEKQRHKEKKKRRRESSDDDDDSASRGKSKKERRRRK